MSLIALDIGERRIGIAISESGILATPHDVLYRQSKQEDFARLRQMMTELKVERVIIGLPYSLSGIEKIGPQARRIKRYAEALAKTVNIPFEYVDESYSTVDAEAFLSARALRGADRQKPAGRGKIPIDAAAAAVILQNYLDATRDKQLQNE